MLDRSCTLPKGWKRDRASQRHRSHISTFLHAARTCRYVLIDTYAYMRHNPETKIGPDHAEYMVNVNEEVTLTEERERWLALPLGLSLRTYESD